jgi:hypothetical protein
MKPVRIIILIVLMIAFLAASSEAGWLIYHKSEFKGKVIDAESKQPIEGAVVVVVYNKSTMSLGAGQLSSIINVRETITDKEGAFSIASYTTIIQPFSWEASASFIIFKPGYGSFPNQRVYPPSMSLPDQEIFFSAGIEIERYLNIYEGSESTFAVLKTGIVELPKLKTRDERLKAEEIGVIDYRSKDLPLLYKALNEEESYLGIPERE